MFTRGTYSPTLLQYSKPLLKKTNKRFNGILIVHMSMNVITSFKFITVVCGTNNIPRNIPIYSPTFRLNVRNIS